MEVLCLREPPLTSHSLKATKSPLPSEVLTKRLPWPLTVAYKPMAYYHYSYALYKNDTSIIIRIVNN